MDIADVVKRSGLSPSTLHYYEEKQLISPTGRRGLRRQYDEGVLDRLSLIAFGQRAGFTLDEIRTHLVPDGGVVVNRAALREKAERIDREIRALTATRDALVHAAECPAPSHLECPKFRALLDEAGAARKRRPARP